MCCLCFFLCILTFSTWFADTFTLGGGYGILPWLIILYIAGAWIKKNKINEKWRVSFWITMITICIAATWLWETFAPVLSGFCIPILVLQLFNGMLEW